MRLEFFDVTIESLDGTEEVVRATRQHVDGGVLHLFYRSGEYAAREEHLGSWPLGSVKKWTCRHAF